MHLDPAPRLNKWIFLAIDLGLLLTAFVIVFFARDPYAPLPFTAAVLCVGLAALIGLVPFLTDFAADSADFVQQERARAADHAQRLQGAVDNLGRAAAQIKAVEEAVAKVARDAETLPYRMQEKLAEFNETLSAREERDHEALETELEELRATKSDQLKQLAARLGQSTAEWSALESATRQHLATARTTALADLAAATDKLTAAGHAATTQLTAQLQAALATLDAKLAALARAAATPVPPAVFPPATPPAPATAPADETPAAPPIPTDAGEPAKPRKPRAPRKPRPEDTPAAEPAASLELSAPDAEAPAPAPTEDEPAPAPAPDDEPGDAPAPVESATSSDGATRLLATAYIGIGNKLYLRGDGPGLSWDAGVPLQFISIGKWGWSTTDAVGPIRCRLYKNDETACLTGEILLEPGRHTEVTALF